MDRRLEISRPGTMRRKFDLNAQRLIWVSSRPNKGSSEEIPEIDTKLLNRANSFGGVYQPLEERLHYSEQASYFVAFRGIRDTKIEKSCGIQDKISL